MNRGIDNVLEKKVLEEYIQYMREHGVDKNL